MIGCFTAPSALRFERPATTGPTLMLALMNKFLHGKKCMILFTQAKQTGKKPMSLNYLIVSITWQNM